MSKFATLIPVDVETLVKALPAGSFLNKIRLADDQKGIVIEWDCDNLRTPYTVPVDISPSMILDGEHMPACVKIIPPLQKVQNEEVAPKAIRKVKKAL